MEMLTDHIDLRWKSRGRRSKRPDFDELAAAEALILLANCDGGFCPSFPTTTSPKEPKNFASFLPATSSIPHPNLPAVSVSATTAAAVNVNTPLITPEKHHQQQPSLSTATASAATPAAVKVNNQEPYSPDTPLIPNSSIFHPKKHQQQQPATASASATTSAAVNVKNQEQYSPDTPLMEISSIFHPKKHHQQQPSWGTATASATTAAAVNVKMINQEPYNSPETPFMAVAHHDCWLCGKRFKSHHALGGHMTSHRLKPETTTVSDDGNSSAVKKVRIHECDFCHERFSTGQALGGHKRKHYEGPSLARKSANYRRSISFRIGRDDGGASTSLVSRPSIDLNMPPPEE